MFSSSDGESLCSGRDDPVTHYLPPELQEHAPAGLPPLAFLSLSISRHLLPEPHKSG